MTNRLKEAVEEYVLDFVIWWKSYALTLCIMAVAVVEFLQHGNSVTFKALFYLVGLQGVFSCTKNKEGQ